MYSDLELARLAVPRRVYTMSQIEHVVDRVTWLHNQRELVGGLRFIEEPPVLSFFFGKLAPVDGWVEILMSRFKRDYGAES